MSDHTPIINLTPHDITIIDDDGEIICVFPPHGTVARVDEITTQTGYIGEHRVPLFSKRFSDLKFCTLDGAHAVDPERMGVVYIVSLFVASHMAKAGYKTLVTSDQIRDTRGAIIGTHGLSQVVN